MIRIALANNVSQTRTIGKTNILENWYPTKLRVPAKGNVATPRFMNEVYSPQDAISYAEIGIYHGGTVEAVLRAFPNSKVSIFDFEDTITQVTGNLPEFAGRITGYGNSTRFLDSYNWPLMKLIKESQYQPIYDYIFLDGAHTVATDALTFFLCDRLLKVGGYMDFDDYGWCLRRSSLDPKRVPETARMYTDEQIDAYQVKMIVDDLVKPDERYEMVEKNKIFKKIK